jgi:cysteinyl-tRNA synthetase
MIKKRRVKLYNTLSKKVEMFEPIDENRVTIYSCGPTVHKNHTQIGNLRSYTFSDLLKRYFIYLGYEVSHVIKLTDVDDHIVEDCLTHGYDFTQYIEQNITDFIKQLDKVNLIRPTNLPQVTKNIDLLVQEIKALEKKGYVYYSNGSAYFDISKVDNYGQLAGIEKQHSLKKNAQGRLKSFVNEDKKNENDFCLWKNWTKADGDIFWNTIIGKGRPGWHLECSSLARKNLGTTIDIHTGGISHIFPHHTNEIAIAEAITGKKFVNYWLHHDYLIVDKQAMSKVAGTWYVLADVLDKGYHPLILRYVLMKTHYRQALNFTWQAMEEGKGVILKLISFYHFLHQTELLNEGDSTFDFSRLINRAHEKFSKSLANDMNFSDAISAVFEFVGEINSNNKILSKKDARDCIDFMLSIDCVLGFINVLYDDYQIEFELLRNKLEVNKILESRDQKKSEKLYSEADRLRGYLESNGLKVVDVKDRGTYCELINFL